MNNKKGFTLIETLFVMVFGMAFIYNAAVLPIGLIRQFKEYGVVLEYKLAMNNVIKYIKDDLSNAGGDVEIAIDTLRIGNSVYSFEADGLYLTRGGIKSPLTTLKMQCTDGGTFFLVQTTDETVKDKMNLKFNKNYSSFDGGY